MSREAILALEESMRGLEGFEDGDGPCKITHHFAPGVYAREMRIPAGCLITGRIHKTEHICILSQGRVSVSDGSSTNTYEAPCTILSKVGAKRAIYAHEDSVWTNIHPSELDDPDEIERTITADTFEELDRFLEQEELKRIS